MLQISIKCALYIYFFLHIIAQINLAIPVKKNRKLAYAYLAETARFAWTSKLACFSSENIFFKNASELAETARFELAIPFWGIHTFQACSFNHSDTSPYFGGAKVRIKYSRMACSLSFKTIITHL